TIWTGGFRCNRCKSKDNVHLARIGSTTGERTAKVMANAERLPPIAADDLTPEQRQAAEEFKAGRGYGILGPFAVMGRSPEVMLRAKAMGDYLRFRNVLPKRVGERVILLIAPDAAQGVGGDQQFC